ncbi:MAG: DegT/DnrJ/EryC1/StrS family aminotransferase, partial [Deltaproteobacteria bacterium]|nr:DegT/DnrJ/EryC1/StrS family aminotransferase [Deltaproteobacteria bacterium]
GVRHAVSVSNGTCAIHLALKVLDIGPGDEVIVPAFTFPATVNAVYHSGATPVLVDCLPDHWSMDPAEAVKAISPATKAVIPVHLYGHPCDMASIMEVARRHKIFVIEDAAEAHGAECLGRKVGGLGDIGCFSFYGNKVITTGEGGMCVTDDERLNDRLRKMRDHGMSKVRRYWQEEIGFNYRLTNLNAALGVAQLEQIEEFLARRAELARMYENALNNISGFRIYTDSPFGKKIDWLFCLFVEEIFPFGRDLLLQQLNEYKIDARPTFYPIHLMPLYKSIKKARSLDNAERFGLTGINLPIYPSLPEEDIQYIVEVLRDCSFRS